MNRYQATNRAGVLGITGNIFLLIIKGIIGFISNSQSMIADFFNSFGDILSSLMTFIGSHIASIPSDEDHNLGHGKAEYIYSMLISVVMISVGLFVLKDSIINLIKRIKYNYSIWLIIVCIITIIIKLFLYIYIYKISKKNNSLLLKANSIDHKNDCLMTILNLISCILCAYNIYFIDSIVGIIISLYIIISTFKIFKESYNVLMDKSISISTRNKVYDIVKRHSEIVKTNHFNSTPVGYKYQISLTIFVDGNMSTFESHNIADKLEKQIIEEIDEIYLAVIHVNPI